MNPGAHGPEPPGRTGRPRLLFLRPPTDDLPAYIAHHFEEQARCLQLFFEVATAPLGGDYRALCLAHRPDLVMFESGAYRRAIAPFNNIDAFPEIPRIGFLNADAYCPTRSVFLSDMERWGVETFFTHSVSMAEYTPAIAERLFVWPNSIEPETFTDYGAPKLIPVLATGSRAPHYPWRNEALERAARHYPTLTTPHFGWFDRASATRAVHGQAYARLINSALVAPTCGTIAKEVVRKHFEIPGCRTCLVTEPTAGVSAAGFVDMENCVFADPATIIDKLDHLFANPDLLQAITERGYRHVHEHHTWSNRDQIRQWFELRSRLTAEQRILQLGPFGGLVAVDRRTDPRGNLHLLSGGRDRQLLHQAEARRRQGDLGEARRLYLRCLNLHPVGSEPQLGLALCALQQGDAPGALQWLEQTIGLALDQRHAADPDPVEWAYLIVALLCLGRVHDAARRSRMFPALRHPELRRARAAVARVLGLGQQGEAERAQPCRPSLHLLPELSDEEWNRTVGAMLQACGQPRLARRLARGQDLAADDPTAAAGRDPPPLARSAARPRGAAGEPPAERIWRHARRLLADPAYPGLFLAARGRRDRFAELARQAAADSRAASILLVPERPWSLAAEAVVAGAWDNPALPQIIRIRPPRRGLLGSARPTPGDPLPISDVAPGEVGAQLLARGLARLDLMVIDGPAPAEARLPDLLGQAGAVLINRLDAEPNHRLVRLLLEPRSGFECLAFAETPPGGCASFRRRELSTARDGATARSPQAAEQAWASACDPRLGSAGASRSGVWAQASETPSAAATEV